MPERREASVVGGSCPPGPRRPTKSLSRPGATMACVLRSTHRQGDPRSVGHRMIDDAHGRPTGPRCGLSSHGLWFHRDHDWTRCRQDSAARAATCTRGERLGGLQKARPLLALASGTPRRSAALRNAFHSTASWQGWRTPTPNPGCRRVCRRSALPIGRAAEGTASCGRPHVGLGLGELAGSVEVRPHGAPGGAAGTTPPPQQPRRLRLGRRRRLTDHVPTSLNGQ